MTMPLGAGFAVGKNGETPVFAADSVDRSLLAGVYQQ